ncbi:class I SAM-dependent methyltransferase [Thermoleophilia bacterium SCSIO 60948]|nr:class I SAM-dependent methyltransferase [Thermoleophilia bacterium SCSIO 60948]
MTATRPTPAERARSAAVRRAALSLFDRARSGRLEITEAGRRHEFGEPGHGPVAEVEIRDLRAWGSLLSGGAGLAESYVEGWWTTPDLVAVIRFAARNLAPLDGLRARFHPILAPLKRLSSRVPRNTRSGARANISAHYDIGNELFESFLDPTMMYSAAVYETPGATLEQAQTAKLDRICRRLELGPRDHLLEIGTGWGGLAIHAAKTTGCRVTTTTISREQRAYALEAIEAAGLSDRIEVLLCDYRDLEGRYSKLVSIEMIEAVGWQYFETYFACCSELLEPDGLMFLQAIVIADELYESEKAARSFANTQVFPGGCLPSQELISKLIRRETDMRTIWLDDISGDYALTLAAWRERFDAAQPELAPHGYDGRFTRLWDFYLAFSEAGFAERRIRDLQLVFAKPAWRPERTSLGSASVAPVASRVATPVEPTVMADSE